MKKIFTAIALCAVTLMASATDYVLDPAALYADIKNGVNTNVTPPFGSKYEMTNHVVSGIYTVYSPSDRKMRIDLASGVDIVTFADGTEATHRLETNGSSNSTNGRIIYIDCPSAGTLTVYAWTGTAGRGYTVNTASAVGATPVELPLHNTNVAMPATAVPHPVHEYAIASAGVIALVPNLGFYYGKIKFSDTPSSIESTEASANYKLLPNGIQVEGAATRVKIYNLGGSLVKESSASFVSTNDLVRGIYLLTVVTDGATSSLKMVR